MTKHQIGTDTERTELIQRAYQLTGDILRTQKLLMELEQAQVGIGVTLVRRYGMGLAESATVAGMTRQKLARELKIRAIMGSEDEA